VKFKLGENLPAASATVLAGADRDADTVGVEGLAGAPDQDVVAAASADGRILISLDAGMADIRAYPPGRRLTPVTVRRGAQPPVRCSHRHQPTTSTSLPRTRPCSLT
jgi:predicted nuclease of predicted toxin-antitoxin system